MENQCVWRHCVVLKAQSSNHTWAVCESAPFKHSGVTNYSEYSAMDRYCAACSSANSSVWPTGASPLWNCSIHTRLSFEDKNSQAGRINIERQEGRSYLVPAEWDGTRLVNSGEIQDWKSTRSLKCTSDFSGELGSQRCLLKDGRLQSFCLI